VAIILAILEYRIELASAPVVAICGVLIYDTSMALVALKNRDPAIAVGAKSSVVQ
jgi:hypothetical protein